MFRLSRRKKQKDIQLQSLADQLKVMVTDELKEVKELIGDYRGDVEQTIRSDSEKLVKRTQKQTAMMEDILEVLEEFNQDKTALQTQIKKKDEQMIHLVKLIARYHEYFMTVSGYVAGKRTWSEAESEQINAQFHLLNSELNNEKSLNGIETIDACGGKVDTRLHQVIKVEETTEPLNGEIVKEVLEPGCIYQGNIVVKAKVIVYVYQESEGKNV